MKNDNTLLGATIFSRGLYSSWCHLHRYNILFDCGEGCATALGNETSNITKIFLGHGHGDHTLGLPSFIGCRNSGRGMSKNPDTRDHNKPLEIFYPAGDNPSISDLRDFIMSRNINWLRYDLKWTPIKIGDEIEIAKNTFVCAFETKHQKHGLTLGYVVREYRSRLKPEYRDKDIRTLLASGTVNRDSINETYGANHFAYCLDAYDIPAGHGLVDCAHVIMDCTFLNKNDRTDPTHFTIDESLLFCHNNGIKNMYAAHISPRYDSYTYRAASFKSDITAVHILDNTKVNFI